MNQQNKSARLLTLSFVFAALSTACFAEGLPAIADPAPLGGSLLPMPVRARLHQDDTVAAIKELKLIAKWGFNEPTPPLIFTRHLARMVREINCSPFGLENGWLVTEPFTYADQNRNEVQVDQGCIISSDSDETTSYRLTYPQGIIPAVRVLESVLETLLDIENENATEQEEISCTEISHLKDNIKDLLEAIDEIAQPETMRMNLDGGDNEQSDLFTDEDRHDMKQAIEKPCRQSFYNIESITNALAYIQRGFASIYEMMDRGFAVCSLEKEQIFEIVNLTDKILTVIYERNNLTSENMELASTANLDSDSDSEYDVMEIDKQEPSIPLYTPVLVELHDVAKSCHLHVG